MQHFDNYGGNIVSCIQRCHIFPFATTAYVHNCKKCKSTTALLLHTNIRSVCVFFKINSRLVAGMAFVVLVTIFVVFEIMTYQQYWTYSYTGKLSCANGGRHKTGKKEHVCQNKYVDIFENICTTNAITGLHHFGCCCLLKALHKQYGSTICYTTTWAASFFRV